MKKIKTKLFMSLSVLIIGFLISTSLLNPSNTKALLEERQNQYNTDSFDSSAWKWSTTKVVSTESTESSSDPSLVTDAAGNVHTAWYDLTDYDSSETDMDIFYKRWNASTSIWTTTEVVSTESTEDSQYTSFVTDAAGNVHIVWEDLTDYDSSGTDRDIFYKRWNASTSIWTTTEVVSIISTAPSRATSIATDSAGDVHIVWADSTYYDGAGTDWDIFYIRWDASTSTWTTTEVVSTESTGNSWATSIVTDSAGDVHIAWHDVTNYDEAGTDQDIFYKRWDVSTSSWSTTEVVSTESTSNSYEPSVTTDAAGNVRIAWHDETNYAGCGTDQDIFYKRWDVSTSLWSTTEVVSTESTGNSWYSSLATDSAGNIHIAWRDETDYAGSGIDMDIFYKRWDPSISLWTTTEVVSTESTGVSNYPSLATDFEGNVHIAWADFTDYDGAETDCDIFYKQFAGPPAAPQLAFIIPNTVPYTTILLDWNDVLRVTNYHVYRSTSYIWSVEDLVPIYTVPSTSFSAFMDIVPSEGIYYYVVVAENFVGNSSISNCQYVEVKFADLDIPELALILPNPTEITSISLVWDSVNGATEYYIYRSDTYIWSVDSLTPIDTVGSTAYVDTLPSEGGYFYVVIASDGVRNSTHSNCEYVEYKLPTLNEFIIPFGILCGVAVILVTTINLRKRKNERIK